MSRRFRSVLQLRPPLNVVRLVYNVFLLRLITTLIFGSFNLQGRPKGQKYHTAEDHHLPVNVISMSMKINKRDCLQKPNMVKNVLF